jgi:hypothetical protein
LFTSDIDQKNNKKMNLKRSVIVYMILSFTAIIINYVYGLFGHGVTSASMTWMFLYPLLGGTLGCLLIELIVPSASKAEGFRLAFNLYNSGIAALTVGSFLKGILEIAGADSPYTVAFFIAGWAFTAAGFLLFLIKPLRLRAIDSD